VLVPVTFGPSPRQELAPCPTVIISVDPPDAHCCLLPMPATRINRVPFARLTVHLREVTPKEVVVVGFFDIADEGMVLLVVFAYVTGIANELPSGMMPNMVGTVVVVLRSARAPLLSDVGHDIVRFEHCGGNPLLLSVMLNANE
jgi:hypothetical protein